MSVTLPGRISRMVMLTVSNEPRIESNAGENWPAKPKFKTTSKTYGNVETFMSFSSRRISTAAILLQDLQSTGYVLR